MKLETEDDNGYIEYKLNLDNMHSKKFQKYISQMRYRLQEGNGKVIYIIGVLDSGILFGLNSLQKNQAVRVLKKMCSKNSADITSILDCYYNDINFLIMKATSLRYTEHNLNYLTF